MKQKKTKQYIIFIEPIYIEVIVDCGIVWVTLTAEIKVDKTASGVVVLPFK